MATSLTLSNFANAATVLGVLVDIPMFFCTVIGAIVAIIALFYTAYQIRMNTVTNRAKFWLELEKMSKSHDQVHLNLRPGGKWSDGISCPKKPKEWLPLEDYMGFFEHCEIMMKMKLIDESTFKDIFEYRLKNIVNNHSIVEAKLRGKEAKLWKNFLDLLKRFDISLPQGDIKMGITNPRISLNIKKMNS